MGILVLLVAWCLVVATLAPPSSQADSRVTRATRAGEGDTTSRSGGQLSTRSSAPKRMGKKMMPLREATGTFIRSLHYAPYPYRGRYGDTNVDFFDFVDPTSGERFHTNRNGDHLSERAHYTDNRVLFHIPSHFNPRKPFAYVLFFHGLGSDIETANRDYGLTRQIEASSKNVIFIMPQLAKDAMDSSPGKFFRKDGFRRFMGEVAQIMTARLGKRLQRKLEQAPILLTAFSGGYKSVAYVLDCGGVSDRVRGIFLMDALYEDVDKFERWILQHIRRSFVVSIATPGSCETNMRDLLSRLGWRGIEAHPGWPRRVSKGDIRYSWVNTDHLAIPILGPPEDPLASLLEAIDFVVSAG